MQNFDFFYPHIYHIFKLWFYMNFAVSGSNASKAEEALLKKLFEHYDVNARPVLNDSQNVTVKIGMTVSQIIDVVSRI